MDSFTEFQVTHWSWQFSKLLMEDEDLSELSGKTMNDLDIYDISNAHLDDDYYDSDNKAAVVLNSGV